MFDDDGDEAIERALRDVHGTASPRRFSLPPADGPVRVAGCVAVRVEGAKPHWLIVTRGFTELGAKVDDDPDVSGWGFELTMRVPATSDDDDLSWVAKPIASVSRHIAAHISALRPFQDIRMPAPSENETLGAIVVVPDFELLPKWSKNGRFTFFQLVGITSDEHEALLRWDPDAFVELLQRRDPLLSFRPTRPSYMSDPNFAREAREGSDRDGSSVGVAHAVPLFWRSLLRDLEIHLTADAVQILKAAMKQRLAHGSPMDLFGEWRRTTRADGSVSIRSQIQVSLRAESGVSGVENVAGTKVAVVRMSDQAISDVLTILDTVPGTYELPSLRRVRFVVVSPEQFDDPNATS